jgi:hypothetical protein
VDALILGNCKGGEKWLRAKKSRTWWRECLPRHQ